MALHENPVRKTVEAAYRYLVRSHEILESAHGPSHAAVATGCLAVASVQNILDVCPKYSFLVVSCIVFISTVTVDGRR